jgi:hypothetical protein
MNELIEQFLAGNEFPDYADQAIRKKYENKNIHTIK